MESALRNPAKGRTDAPATFQTRTGVVFASSQNSANDRTSSAAAADSSDAQEAGFAKLSFLAVAEVGSENIP